MCSCLHVNSYNTGMIGVGNYSNKGNNEDKNDEDSKKKVNNMGYSVAGGIFGYATDNFKRFFVRLHHH